MKIEMEKSDGLFILINISYTKNSEVPIYISNSFMPI